MIKLANNIFKCFMYVTILLTTIQVSPIKALSSQNGDDILKQAYSYANWDYLAVGTCTGLVTRVLNDLGIAKSIVGTMQGSIAQYSTNNDI